MNGVLSFSFSVELASIVLFLLVVYYVLRIGKITGSFTAWNLIAAGFVLIVLRRLLSIVAPHVAHGGVMKEFAEPLVLLAITVLFIVGFHKLTKAFEKQ